MSCINSGLLFSRRISLQVMFSVNRLIFFLLNVAIIFKKANTKLRSPPSSVTVRSQNFILFFLQEKRCIFFNYATIQLWNKEVFVAQH